MLRSFLAITTSAFRESTRQPVYGATLLTALGFLALNPTLSAFTFGEDATFLVDLGLSTLFVAGLLLAAFTASGVIAGEIDRRTVLIVLAKPISRASFVLAKFAGVALAVALACTVWAAALLLSLRLIVHEDEPGHHRHGELEHLGPAAILALAAVGVVVVLATLAHYRRGRSFSARLALGLAIALPLTWLLSLFLDDRWALQSPAAALGFEGGHVGQVALAIALIVEGLLILTAIAVACATRLGQTATLVICGALFLLGLSNESLFGPPPSRHPVESLLLHGLPDLQSFWLADVLAHHERIPLAYLADATAYAVLYVVAVLAVAVASFHTRETS